MFELQRGWKRMREAFETLEEFEDLYEREGEDAYQEVRKAEMAITDLTEATEEFWYNFPALGSKSWFTGFHRDLAHAHWRVKAGEFHVEDSSVESNLHRARYEVRSILSNTSTSNHQGIMNLLWEFLEHQGNELSAYDLPEEYREEAYEVQDLFCIGYYSTALLVVGRAIEKALLELGEARDVRTVRAYGNMIDWPDTKFAHKATALHRVNMPERHGKVLSKKQYHQMSILIDYRNSVAHSEYANIEREAALREMKSAFQLLIELCEAKEYLNELPDEEIDTVEGQKAQ